MITKTIINEILSLYKKHGWNISRVLLSADIFESLENSEKTELFGDLEITKADINAVWFSRPAKNGKTAFELRHLSEKPFALFEVFDEDTLDEIKSEKFNELENRLANFASNK